MAWFKGIFHSLGNRHCETFVLIFASWSISDSLCFSVTSIHVLTDLSQVQSCDLLLSFLVKPIFSLTNMCVLVFKSVNTPMKACSGNREPNGHSGDERKVASE